MSVRWNRSTHEENLLNLFKSGAILPNDTANTVFMKWPELWTGIKESNFSKHFRRIRLEAVNSNRPVVKMEPGMTPAKRTGK